MAWPMIPRLVSADSNWCWRLAAMSAAAGGWPASQRWPPIRHRRCRHRSQRGSTGRCYSPACRADRTQLVGDTDDRQPPRPRRQSAWPCGVRTDVRPDHRSARSGSPRLLRRSVKPALFRSGQGSPMDPRHCCRPKPHARLFTGQHQIVKELTTATNSGLDGLAHNARAPFRSPPTPVDTRTRDHPARERIGPD